MTDRELTLLFRAAESPRPVSIPELAAAILETCPGPRTAERYAKECAWNLFQADFFTIHDFKTKGRCYSITAAGLAFLDRTFSLTPSPNPSEDFSS